VQEVASAMKGQSTSPMVQRAFELARVLRGRLEQLDPITCRTRAASVLQASGFRGDVTVFRLKARPRPKTGSEPAFLRSAAERVYTIEAAVNRRVVGSSPTRGAEKAMETGPSCSPVRVVNA
jgi:hypothetical protein